MKSLRILGLLSLLCLLAASALSAEPAGQETAAPVPAAVDQPLPWELNDALCGQPSEGASGVVPAPSQMACFCVEDRGYCRRNYGNLYYCNPDPCQCEHI